MSRKHCPRCGSVLTPAQIESDKQTDRFAWCAVVLVFLVILMWSARFGTDCEPGSICYSTRVLLGWPDP